jgi:hypothetical protein
VCFPAFRISMSMFSRFPSTFRIWRDEATIAERAE